MAGTSSVAKKAWAWIGQRSKTTMALHVDVAPASYELETTAATSENYLVVLRATYTVGPRMIIDTTTTTNLVASPPAHTTTSNDKGGHCPCCVRKLLERHVGALIAGMTTEQMFVKGSLGFLEDVLGRVNLDIANNKPKSGGGGDGLFFVQRARVERFAVHVPSDKLSVAAAEKDGAVAPTMTPFFVMQFGDNNKAHGVKLGISVRGEAAVAMAVVDPATKTVEWENKVKVPAVAAELHMELEGKTTLRLKHMPKKSSKAAAVRVTEQELGSATMVVVTEVPRRMRMDKKNRSRDATKSFNSRRARIHDLQDDAAGAGVRGQADN